MNYALANGATGDIDTAIVYYEKALRLDTDLARDIYFQRAQILIVKISEQKYASLLLKDVEVLKGLAAFPNALVNFFLARFY